MHTLVDNPRLKAFLVKEGCLIVRHFTLLGVIFIPVIHYFIVLTFY